MSGSAATFLVYRDLVLDDGRGPSEFQRLKGNAPWPDTATPCRSSAAISSSPTAASRRRSSSTRGSSFRTSPRSTSCEPPTGEAALRKYFRTLRRARATQFGTGLVLESATWRASADWGAQARLRAGRRSRTRTAQAIRLARGAPERVRERRARRSSSADASARAATATSPTQAMSADEAEAYHRDADRDASPDTAADMVHRHHDELRRGGDRHRARGRSARACRSRSRSPSRPTAGCRRARRCGDAIEQVDAATSGHPAYYMINCAHPTHFERRAAARTQPWVERIRGLRANASRDEPRRAERVARARRRRPRRSSAESTRRCAHGFRS